MRKELLDKEVLCILDTRQIQRYMFRSNSYFDSLGGSDLMTHILGDAILFALRNVDPPLAEDEYDISMDPDVSEIPWFASEKTQFQLISNVAGNAICLVRSGALCQQLIRKISRYYLDHAYSLNLAAAVTEKTDNLQKDTSALYEQLEKVKAAGEISDPLGALPIVRREHNTGDPAVGLDEETGEFYSTVSEMKRAEARRRPLLIQMKDMKPFRTSGGKDYLAVIHADGNNFGITIGRLLAETGTYEDSIRLRRRLSRDLTKTMQEAVQKSISQLETAFRAERGDDADFIHAFQLSHQAGDDINCICSADLAIPFINRLFSNLEDCFLWKAEDRTVPLYICAGIAFVPPHVSFHDAFDLAEGCCGNAKAAAKTERNLRCGLAGNWMDFHVSMDNSTQDLDLIRAQAYVTKENLNLLLRPYSLDPVVKDESYAYGKLLSRAAAVKNLPLDEYQKNILRQSYVMGRAEFRQWIQSVACSGIDLTEILGAPLYQDSRNRLHATWFDAAELSDFM